MGFIASILLSITVLTTLVVIGFGFKRWYDRNNNGIKLLEPDLLLVDKPHLIGKIPENEDRIPDSNATSQTFPYSEPPAA